MPLPGRDADLALLIVVFSQRHLGNADFLSPAFCRRGAGLVFLRRDTDLALLNVAFKRRGLKNASFLSFAYWSPNVDFARPVQLRRDAGMSLAFYICWTDSCSNFLSLLSMCASPLLTFSISITLYGLLGTPGNLELRKGKDVAGLTFNNVGLAGLVGDVDAGLTCDAANNDALYAGHLRRSL